MKKGFTLIELLAVIAILAILVVIAVPNVIKMYKNAKTSSFVSQVQNIYKAVNNQSMMNEISGEAITRFYYASESDYENKLSLSGNKNVYYDIEVEEGKIKKLIVSNKEYSINIENINGANIADITKDIIKVKDESGYIAVEEGTTYQKDIYGVEFNLSTGITTRTDNAVGKTFSNPSTSNQITSDFDTLQIYKEMTEETDSYGNKFIKIPKFYIKKTVNTDRTIWKYQISKEKKDSSYYLPACFVDEDTGEIYPYILVSKYNASLSTDGTKLESKSGKVALVSKTISQFRTLAQANGSGYQLLDIHTVDVLQTLFYIEYAALDSSSIMRGYDNGISTQNYAISSVDIPNKKITMTSGVGANYKVGQIIDVATAWGSRNIATNLRITDITEDIITYEVLSEISTEQVGATPISIGHYVHNVSYLTGLTDTVTTKSGSPVTNTDGKYPMKYRGIENLYAGIWQFVDGINIKDRVAYVSKNAKTYASDIFTGSYTQVGYTNANTNNFVLKMGYDSNNPYIQLPIEVTATHTNSRYKDYYYQDAGNKIAMFGGAWYSGYSGISYWLLNNSSSHMSLLIGTRFLKTP
jgi:prepilin-type N-terminal cleavage/methylation domain-containing protein